MSLQPNKKIFVSYRRDDESSYLIPGLTQLLIDRYGRDSVFYDIEDIQLGVDFRDDLNDAMSTASIVLVVIGDRWVGHDLQTGLRRIDRDDDNVRFEVEAALNRSIRVVPVLVGRATMPSEKDLPPSIAKLAYRNAAEIRTGRDQKLHLSDLLSKLDNIMISKTTVLFAEKNDTAPFPKGDEQKAGNLSLSESEKRRLEYWTQLLERAIKTTSLHAKVKPSMTRH